MVARAIASMLLALAAMTLTAVTTEAQTPSWRSKTDGTLPSASDTSDCRAEGRRQALQMYPMRPPQGLPQGSSMSDDSDRRNSVESSVFNQCMRRKGYELVDK